MMDSPTPTSFAPDAGDAIDVLIPVYNGAAWLAESIESICGQTHRALRIHVVDDGSTDKTPEILAGFARLDERIRVYRKPNGGIVEALNHGLRFCTARWLARHDADDVAGPDRLALQLAYLRANADCVAVGGVARHIDGAGRPLGTYVRLRPPEDADATWFPAREPYLMHPFLMVRREAVMAAGNYRHARHAEDSDLYWRLTELGRLHNLSDLLGDYRVHERSISSASIGNGRVMAVNSQRAALAARRRRHNLTDLPFDPSSRSRDAQSLQQMVDAAADDLSPSERHAFELAVAAKLLELTSYLPYELAAEDCSFIGEAGRRARDLSMTPGNRRELRTRLTSAAVRLARAGRGRDARQLLPKRLLPEFALRWLARAALSPGVRRRLHDLALLGRSSDAA